MACFTKHTSRRSPEKASGLRDLGCELIEGGLGDAGAIRTGMEGADAVFHVAGDYRVGVTAADCDDMRASNVQGTRVRAISLPSCHSRSSGR